MQQLTRGGYEPDDATNVRIKDSKQNTDANQCYIEDKYMFKPGRKRTVIILILQVENDLTHYRANKASNAAI